MSLPFDLCIASFLPCARLADRPWAEEEKRDWRQRLLFSSLTLFPVFFKTILFLNFCNNLNGENNLCKLQTATITLTTISKNYLFPIICSAFYHQTSIHLFPRSSLFCCSTENWYINNNSLFFLLPFPKIRFICCCSLLMLLLKTKRHKVHWLLSCLVSS